MQNIGARLLHEPPKFSVKKTLIAFYTICPTHVKSFNVNAQFFQSSAERALRWSECCESEATIQELFDDRKHRMFAAIQRWEFEKNSDVASGCHVIATHL